METEEDLYGCLGVLSLKSYQDCIFIGLNDCNPYFTTNNGSNWQVMVYNSQYVTGNQFILKDSILFIASEILYRSSDNGVTLEKVSISQSDSAISIGFLAVSGTTLFAAGKSGIFRSTDNGTTWTDCTPAEHQSVSDVYTMPLTATENTILVGINPFGILRSDDEGTTWESANSGLYGKVTKIEVIGNSIYAGTVGCGIFRSDDQGKTWTRISRGIFNSRICDLTVTNNKIFAATNGAIYRSTDNGVNWTMVLTENGNEFPAITHKDSMIFTAAGSNGIFYSMDNGTTWNQGIINGTEEYYYMYQIAVGGTDIYAGAPNGLFISINSGRDWDLLKKEPSRFLAADGDAVVAHEYGTSYYLFSSHGQTMDSITPNIDPHVIHAYARNGETVYFSNNCGEIFRSSDNGQNWKKQHPLHSLLKTVIFFPFT